MTRLLIVLVFSFAFVFAQTPDTASLGGKVVDAQKAAMPGVQILAKNTDTGLERSTQTDANGEMRRVGEVGAGSPARRVVVWVCRGANKKIHFNSRMRKDGRGTGLRLGKGVGVYLGVIEDGNLEVPSVVRRPLGRGVGWGRRRKCGSPYD